jgi:hypothetical protein
MSCTEKCYEEFFEFHGGPSIIQAGTTKVPLFSLFFLIMRLPPPPLQDGAMALFLPLISRSKEGERRRCNEAEVVFS